VLHPLAGRHRAPRTRPTAEVERAAGEYAAVVRAVEPSNITRTGTCNLAALRADDDPERAVREVVSTAGPRLERVEPSWASWLALRLVRAAIAAGALEQAERFARVSAAQTERLRLPAGALRAACASAEILLARGDAAGAAALLATAADGVHAPLDAIEARLLAGRAHAAAGDGDRAKAALQQVAADAGCAAAQRLHDEAARQLRLLGTRVSTRHQRRAPGAPHQALTTREHAVAELVAQGHSNKKVAATLYLSDKTVANTLTRVYAKLGVRSRSQLARMQIGTHATAINDQGSR
jgi:DNA-binding CsgD family transcriptional regulator